jgi:hypothetical protein
VTALSSGRADPREVGQTMGVQQAMGGLARVIGPLWATPVYQAVGQAAPFAIAATLMAGVLGMALRVPDEGRDPR